MNDGKVTLQRACDIAASIMGKRPCYQTMLMWCRRGVMTTKGYRQLPHCKRRVMGVTRWMVDVSTLHEFVRTILPNRQGPKIGTRRKVGG